MWTRRPADAGPGARSRYAITALDQGVRGGREPVDVTLETYGQEIPEA